MSRHWILLTALGFVVAGFVFSSLWWAYGRILHSSSPKTQSFKRRSLFWRRFPSLPLSAFGFSKDSSLSDYELLRRYNEDRLEA
jgi:hypothetical protein